MTHQSGSLFEKIHEAAVLGPQGGFGPSAKVYEAHRFNKNCHDDDPNTSCSSRDKGLTIDDVDSPGNGLGGVANVVVSNGTANPSTLATNLAKAVEEVEEKDGSLFHVCLYPGPNDCSDLGATTNVQGQNMGGGSFVHVEANQDVMRDPTRREQLAVTIADTMQ